MCVLTVSGTEQFLLVHKANLRTRALHAQPGSLILGVNKGQPETRQRSIQGTEGRRVPDFFLARIVVSCGKRSPWVRCNTCAEGV